jgi:hypothetical protein
MGRKSEVKSGINVGARVLTRLVETVQDFGGGDDELRLIETDEDIRREIAHILMHKPLVSSRLIAVSRDLSLADLIAAGKYDSVDDMITGEHFPITNHGPATINLVLISFPHDRTPMDVLRTIDSLGYRPANIEELLAFGALRQWDSLSANRIVALGSQWIDGTYDRRVVTIDIVGSRRVLRTATASWSFGRECLFAVVKK